MTILLTNDDGVYSPGLRALREVFAEHHDVWILAPDGERSGFSNSITISEPIRCTKIEDQVYATSGTPADSVILGTRGAIPVEPELIISGINIGPNIGSDIVYSGTCAAARQAVYRGLPGIAVSLDSFYDPFYFYPVATFVRDNLDALLQLWNSDHFININAPNLEHPKGISITTPAMRRYDDELLPFEPPRGGTYYFVDGKPSETKLEEGTDWHAVEEGRISVSPVMLNPVNHAVEEHYRRSSFVNDG